MKKQIKGWAFPEELSLMPIKDTPRIYSTELYRVRPRIRNGKGAKQNRCASLSNGRRKRNERD